MGLSRREKVDQFGQLLVAGLYDRVAWYLEHVFSAHMKGPMQQELAAAYHCLDEQSKDAVRKFATEAMTSMLADTLIFFDEQSLPIQFTTSEGETINICEMSDGIGAELFTDEGWIARFSKYKNGLQDPPTEPVPKMVVGEHTIVVGLDETEDQETTEEFLDRLFGKDEDQDEV